MGPLVCTLRLFASRTLTFFDCSIFSHISVGIMSIRMKLDPVTVSNTTKWRWVARRVKPMLASVLSFRSATVKMASGCNLCLIQSHRRWTNLSFSVIDYSANSYWVDSGFARRFVDVRLRGWLRIVIFLLFISFLIMSTNPKLTFFGWIVHLASWSSWCPGVPFTRVLTAR